MALCQGSPSETKFCSNAASNHKCIDISHACECDPQPVGYAIDRRLLETRRNIGDRVLAALMRAQDRALEPGEGEMRLAAADHRAGQGHCSSVAYQRLAFDCRTARKAEAEDLGGFVERLAQRIVDCGGQAAVLANAVDA